MKKLVLVVAQETAFRAKIARLLQPAGYAVELAANKKRALELIVNQAIDVAIIVSSADVAGIALARQISERVANLIMLAERSDDLARLRQSLSGADFYPSQPLDEQGLLNRLAEVMVSPESDEPAPIPDALCAQGCTIDPAGRTFIHADGRETALTRAEFSLLMALARSPGRVRSRDELNHAIAGHGSERYGRSVDMQIGRLRRKIEPNQKAPTLILTVSA
jgi:DNA-binding response OmpR family regulator